jgi:hypothetical protein
LDKTGPEAIFSFTCKGLGLYLLTAVETGFGFATIQGIDK